MPNGDPVWKRPGHFDRFEFTNLSADPQTLTEVHFVFKDDFGNEIWKVDDIGLNVPLNIGESWERYPPGDQAYGDAVTFTCTVNLAGSAKVEFTYTLQNQPHYSYIWQARLGLQTDAGNNLVAYGNVDFMHPLQASLQPTDWTITP